MFVQIVKTVFECSVPGAGTIVEILEQIGAKITQLKECKVVGERLHKRLQSALDELATHDFEVIKSNGVLAKYQSILEGFLVLVTQYADERGVKNALKRVFKVSGMLDAIMEYNEQLDDVLRLISVEHLASWLEWRNEYRGNQRMVWSLLASELDTIDKIYETVLDIQNKDGNDTLLEKVQKIKRDITAKEKAQAARSDTDATSKENTQPEAGEFTTELLTMLTEIVMTVEKKLGDDLGTPPQWIIAADEISVAAQRLDSHRDIRSL